MRRPCLAVIAVVLVFAVVAGCGSSSTEPTSTVSKEEIEKAMDKMKKLGPMAQQ